MSRLRLTLRLVAVPARQLIAASILILATGGPAESVDIEWVTVGDPGNPANSGIIPGTTGYGSISYTYLIGKYEVTNSLNG
jgi:hypothetical protein